MKQHGPEASDDHQRLLTEALYADLKRLARGQRGRVSAGHTMQTTALVHEAWLKLMRSKGWQSREHFMNSAARAMRHILVDYARQRVADKRGGGAGTDSLDEDTVAAEDAALLRGEPPEQMLALNDALERLAQLSPRLVQVVECRYFAGYDEQETARLLGVTDRTVRRDWTKARAWLFREMSAG
jgi:RNA polymerase sigma factor (TIGR02999 family)